MDKEDREFCNFWLDIVAKVVGIILIITIIGMWGCPQYKVYEQRLAGEAKLRESESSRQVQIQDAHAKEEAAKSLARAEVERAKGVAEANKIIGDGLQGRHEYLMYLWIHNLSENQNKEFIYVPTEAGLPILEAGRFKQPVKEKK